MFYLLRVVFLVVIAALFLGITFKSKPWVINGLKTSSWPKRELRAVWIATVDNIDWPSRKGLPSSQQQAEFLKIVDTHAQTGINAVFVQVRDAADAYYAQSLEPWSEWLTGEQGKAPEPLYDPLVFMIEECHSRGIEFHAWLNLNRAVFKSATSITPDHVSKIKPDWVLSYDGQKLFNFGMPEVRDYITEVVVNLVRNYNIDGIHFDDYFYPYIVAGQTLKDTETFRQNPNGFTSIDDWRRNNIDLQIKQISDAIDAEKPYVKFGVSPFGVWRNKREDKEGSDTFGYNTSYDNLYADTRKWVKLGWIDYVAPQVYFNAAHKLIPYENLVNWWTKNAFGCHLYIGQAAYRIAGDKKNGGWDDALEMPRQLRFNRQHTAIQGSIFFSSKSVSNNPKGFQDSLRQNYYRYPALVPTMPWKDNTPPLMPTRLTSKMLDNEAIELEWIAPEKATDGQGASYYVVYRFDKGETYDLGNPEKIIHIGQQTQFVDTHAIRNKKYLYVVTAIDRLHNESEGASIKVRTK